MSGTREVTGDNDRSRFWDKMGTDVQWKEATERRGCEGMGALILAVWP